MGQIITTQNLVAIKVVRHAGQQDCTGKEFRKNKLPILKL